MVVTHKKKCRDKNARGNVHESAWRARRAAARMERKLGRRIVAYRCPYCGHYHIGRPIPAGKPVPKG